jgi:zinc protease
MAIRSVSLSRFRPAHGLFAALVLSAFFLAPLDIGIAQDIPPIKYEKFVLDNGLQVILHEDHTIPMVSVNVWYHVGSKNEQPGKTGFAHIFEHMMFQGTEHSNQDYFLPLESIGGEVNGSTTEDRTNYWENVPSDQLERALWLEADRMGYLLPAMTEEKLANQKDVVKNEKREGENAPYALSDELLLNLQYPAGHPYAHTVIGSMDDLSAAGMDDVKDFFRMYYAPNNASLCVAGDIDPARTKAMVEKYFASIRPGPPVARLTSWTPPIDGVRRAVAEDKVELPKIYMVWRSPANLKPGDAEMDILGNILAGSKTSRLYKSLVYEKQVAQDVGAGQVSKEAAGEFTIEVTARPGQSLDALEACIDQEVRNLVANGVTDEEIAFAKASYENAFVHRLERIGGFGGKADLLNAYNVWTGEPDYFRRDLQRYRDAGKRSVQQAAREVLDLNRRVILRIVPQGTLTAGEAPAELAQMPGSAGAVRFEAPGIETTTLSNGMKLYLVERHSVPVVEVDLCVMSGWSADPDGKPGTAAMTAALLDEGNDRHSALEISKRKQELGGSLYTSSGFDASFANLNVLKTRLDAGLDLLSEIVLRPTFPAAEVERERQIRLGAVQEELAEPSSLAFRAMQERLFGPGHPYAQPITGNGTTASIRSLTREDLVHFHAANYHPNNTSAIVVGDITMAEATAKLERVFASWKPAETAARSVPAGHPSSAARVVLIDRPGAQQSFIIAAQDGMPRRSPDHLPFEVMNTVLGSYFSARLNMNLREDKGYTYGSYSFPIEMREGGLFVCTAPVHTKYTKETLIEILKEMRAIGADRPPTAEELDTARRRLVQGYPQNFEVIGRIAGELSDLVVNGLPLDEWQTRIPRIEAIDSAEIQRIARKDVRPDDIVFVIVGDRAVIEDEIRSLNLGPIEIKDGSGI